MEGAGWYLSMGSPGKLTVSHFHKSARGCAMCLLWWKPLQDGWRHISCPMKLSATLFWALKSKSCGTMAPQKEVAFTHFQNRLSGTWAEEILGITESQIVIYHIPYHAPGAGNAEQCNGLLKTALTAMDAEHLETGMFK